jgi:hypothetical protein
MDKHSGLLDWLNEKQSAYESLFVLPLLPLENSLQIAQEWDVHVFVAERWNRFRHSPTDATPRKWSPNNQLSIL